MGIFDDLGNTINKVANTTIKKSKDLTELTKLSLKLNTLEGELNELYQNFGKFQYNKEKGLENTDTENYIALIDDKTKEIDELKIDIDELKGVIICPKCQTRNRTDDVYCSNCGEKLPKPEPQEPNADPDKNE